MFVWGTRPAWAGRVGVRVSVFVWGTRPAWATGEVSGTRYAFRLPRNPHELAHAHALANR